MCVKERLSGTDVNFMFGLFVILVLNVSYGIMLKAMIRQENGHDILHYCNMMHCSPKANFWLI